MKENIKDLSPENFEKFVKEGVVVVDFWASWCGPCRVMEPIFEQLAKELNGKVKFGKVNVDEEGELAQKFGVMSIPTLLIYKSGKQVQRNIGVVEKGVLEKDIKKYFG